MNLPNQLTVARLVMALVFVGLMTLPHTAWHVLAYAVFIAATLTDHYDGKIARARNLITNFGKLLDPVADKVLLVAAFIVLMTYPGLNVPGWAIVLIITREFLITGARSLAASQGAVIPANKWGKTKTVIQMVYVFTFLALAIIIRIIQALPAIAEKLPGGLAPYQRVVTLASFWAMVFVALYTVYSGIQFMRINWKVLNLGQDI